MPPNTTLGARIEAHDLTKTYTRASGDPLIALDHVTLEVAPGSVIALTGPSGSGKSTLLHVIGAIEQLDSGSIMVQDQDLTTMSRRALEGYRRTIGFVFQRYHLLPALTVLDNVLAPVLPYKTSWDKNTRARELLDAVGIGDKAGELPSRLSGGQQQRVGIARALVNDPVLILADEPTGNLDSHTGRGVLELLLTVSRSRGTTMILATHDPNVAARCHRVVRLRDGMIINDTTLSERSNPEETMRRINQPG